MQKQKQSNTETEEYIIHKKKYPTIDSILLRSDLIYNNKNKQQTTLIFTYEPQEFLNKYHKELKILNNSYIPLISMNSFHEHISNKPIEQGNVYIDLDDINSSYISTINYNKTSNNYDVISILKFNLSTINKNKLYINALATQKDFQGKGYGRYLMSLLLLFFEKSSLERVKLLNIAKKNNGTSSNIYANLGFIYKPNTHYMYFEKFNKNKEQFDEYRIFCEHFLNNLKEKK